MPSICHPSLLAIPLSAAALCAVAAEPFAPAGAQATLTVEYRFEANGKTQDKIDLHEWRVRRSVDLSVAMVAAKPQATPVRAQPDAGAMAKQQQRASQALKEHANMAPMMADVQAIVARCGEDQKCIERETMKLGAALSGTARLESDLKRGRETAAATQPDADRYQRWQSKQQTGSYALDESWHVVHGDPICVGLPRARCTHDMTRKGAGQWAPGGSGAALEYDAKASTLTVVLPAPPGLLEFVETHATDEPSGTHSTSTPKQPVKGRMALSVSNDAQLGVPRFTLPLKGGWRSQSGEQVIPMGAGAWHGASGQGGKLIVRWRFTAP